MLNTRPIEHRCIDWEVLMGSIEHRVIPRDELDRLVNPKTNQSQ